MKLNLIRKNRCNNLSTKVNVTIYFKNLFMFYYFCDMYFFIFLTFDV